MHTPRTIGALRKQGLDPIGNGPQTFAAYLKSEIERWSGVARAAGVKS